MGEKSIKEIMDERFGVHQIPRRQVSREEMDKLITEAKERGKTKSERKKRTRDNQTNQPGNPCPSCNENMWMKLRDDTGRYYCLNCGEVIHPLNIDLQGAKKITELQKTPALASLCDGMVKLDSSKQIEDPLGKILFPFQCSLCDKVVQFQGTNKEIAMEKAILHKKYDPKTKCNGTFTLLRQNNPNEIRKPTIIPRESTGIGEKFLAPV